jgi:hypothetical protein
MRRRALMAGGCAAAMALAAPAGASAAGGPVPAIQGGAGVSVPASAANYVAVGLGRRTLVERVLRPGGAVARTLRLRGAYGVPGVGYDGSTTGLSADGRTLVLAEVLARFPVRRTRLLELDARRLRVLRRIALAGWWTVDAIAPDGRALYLVHYLRQDGTRYEVRAYDLTGRRLRPAPVVDPREPGEKMQGLALTRAMSADGRFAYTLYQRPEGAPFVHALDTARGTAACIDLPSLAGADLSGVRLTPPTGGRPLLVHGPRVTPLAVDVAARRAAPASTVPPARPARPAPASAAREGSARGGLAAWLVALAAIAGMGAAGAAAMRRRRGRRVRAALVAESRPLGRA